MHEIYFYRKSDGTEPVKEYLELLARKKDKDSRINLNKINDYIEALSRYGLQLKEPYIKHMEGDIWELRPIKNRIFFVAWHNNGFVLLHHYRKQSPKTPKRELERAKRCYIDLVERMVDNE